MKEVIYAVDLKGLIRSLNFDRVGPLPDLATQQMCGEYAKKRSKNDAK